MATLHIMKQFAPFLCIFIWAQTLCVSAQNSLHFDGSNDYVICGTDTSLSNFNKNITIEAWVYADKWQTNVYEGGIVVKEDNNSNYGYMFRAGNGGRLNFAIGQGTWRELTTSSAVLKTNQWHHIAASYDGSYMRLYVDGNMVDSIYESDQIGVSTSTPMVIGGHSNPTAYSRHWAGKIDEVRIWNVTRTASQISQDKGKEYCSGKSNLVGYYKFNQGTANGSNTSVNVAKDYSGRKNEGKLLNFDLIKSSSNWTQGVSLLKNTVYDTFSVSKCTRYQLPGSSKFVYSTGVYTATIDNYMGCDSQLTINVSIKASSRTDLKYVVCDSMKSPNSNKYYTKSGVYNEVLVNFNGCDSVVSINLTVTQPTLTEKKYRACNAVVLDRLPSKTVYESGTFSDTFRGWGGCDSVVLHRFEVLKPSRDTQNLYLCNFIACPTDKNVVYKKIGVYYDTISNYLGCDSFIVYNVVSARTEGSISVKACGSYTLPSGSRTYTESGVFRDTLIGANYLACDSFVVINLIINKPKVESVSKSACEEFITPQGQRTTESGKLFESIPSYLGCDSINYIYNVSIVKINTTVSRDWNTLISGEVEQAGTAFQWLRCAGGFEPISGATAPAFDIAATGEFAAEITKGNCIDTSRCIIYAFTNNANIPKDNICVYPNPTEGVMHITLPKSHKNVRVFLFNGIGQLVETHELGTGADFVWQTQVEAGIYALKVGSGSEEIGTFTIVKQ